MGKPERNGILRGPAHWEAERRHAEHQAEHLRADRVLLRQRARLDLHGLSMVLLWLGYVALCSFVALEVWSG